MALLWESAVCLQILRSPKELDKLRNLLRAPEAQESLERKHWCMDMSHDATSSQEQLLPLTAPLHFTALLQDLTDVDRDSLTRTLVEEGLAVNSFVRYVARERRDSHFETALHIAARRNLVGLARTLLELGADPELLGTVEDGDDDIVLLYGTPLDFARAGSGRDNPELLALLMSADNERDRRQQRGSGGGRDSNPIATATSRIKEMPAKSMELEEAMEIQAKIADLRCQWAKRNAEYVGKIEALEEELRALRERHLEERLTKECQVKDLEESSGYRSTVQMSRLTEEVEQLHLHLHTVKEALERRREEEEESEEFGHLRCPVCLIVPRAAIFCCGGCGEMICRKCREKSKACPMCGEEFGEEGPMRNKLAEKMVAAAVEDRRRRKSELRVGVISDD